MEFDQFPEDNKQNSIRPRDLIEKYLEYYKWFLFAVCFFCILAYLKLKHEPPKYNVSATIMIKDKEKGSSAIDLSAFDDLGMLLGSDKNSLENEIQIIKSRSLMTKVVKELKLNINYLIESDTYDREQYPNFPIILNVKSDSVSIENINSNCEILIISNNEFEFFDFDDISLGNKSFGQDFEVNFGDKENPNRLLISVDVNQFFSANLIGKTIIVKIKPIAKTVDNYLRRIEIQPINEILSKVLTISIDETVIEKGAALINNLNEQYNADGIRDKNLITQATIDFLNLRLELISNEIMAIESTAEQFKTKNRMVDAGGSSGLVLQSSSVNEAELIDINTQVQLANYMLDQLERSEAGEILPANIGLSNAYDIELISEYNTLVLERNRIFKSSSSINPIIVHIDSQLIIIKNSLINSLESTKSSFQIQIDALIIQSGKLNSRIASVPKNERKFRDIVRQQETKNALYVFLLQKREEAILSSAVSISKAKIIDQAYSSGDPVSPKRVITYIEALLLGILIPLFTIYIVDVLDTKVRHEKDLTKFRIPYLGQVPKKISKTDSFITEGDNSKVAEAFRYVRTNIGFMLENNEFCKTIFVTSTIGHEGKTFISINLASSIAMSGKKTLLLGMDLRAPKITDYLELKDVKIGVTNYIVNHLLSIDDIIQNHPNLKNLDVISSGDLPPNPVELLMSKRVNELFEEVKKKYEYIIVDTAPAGMVTDTIQISNYADLSIYVVKANILDKRMLHIPEKLFIEGKLKNMAFLMNGSDGRKGTYGYGYGYGVKKKKSWYSLKKS